MGFHAIFSNKLEILAARFAADRRAAGGEEDYLAAFTVVLPTGGLEAYWRYFAAASPELGIAANFETPFLSAFMHRVLERFAPDYAAVRALFAPENMLWRIAEELAANPRTYPEVVAYLSAGGEATADLRRIQLARVLARCFDRYMLFRPELPEAWRNGRMLRPGDGTERFEMRLFNRLSESAHGRTPDAVLEEFLRGGAAVREAAPGHFAVFGVSALPRRMLDFFVKCGMTSRVDFYALGPCAEFWGETRTLREHARVVRVSGENDLAPGSRGNALLGSFGAAGRAFAASLAEHDGEEFVSSELLYRNFIACDSPAVGPDDYGTCTLLQALQQDVLGNFERGRGADGELRGHVIDFPANDDSVTVHSCHGTRREVEVLHDRLLDLVERGGCQARDLFVTAPDIGLYEADIRAVFGAGPLRDSCAICDRSYRETGTLIPAFLELFTLFAGRFEAEPMLDFLEYPAVGRAFGIAAEDLASLRSWASSCGIRWGENAAMRGALCRIAFDEYSWRKGLDRLLGGFALASGAEPADFAPAVGVEGGASLLLGRFAWYAETLFACGRELETPRTPRGWMKFLLDLMTRVLASGEEDYAELGELRNAAFALGQGGDARTIAFDAARDVFENALSTPGRRDGFLRGRITFCSMMPMRNVPRRVVAVLGLSDGRFPRRDERNSFDLIRRHPRAGDPSRSAEDRYLFLESVLSAREKLLLFYSGESPRTGETIAPSVPLGELLDVLTESFTLGGRAFAPIRHALQGFSPGYFDGADPDKFTYSRADARVSRVLTSGRGGDARRYCRELAPCAAKPECMSLDDFLSFFRSPSDFFMRFRLGTGRDRRGGGGIELLASEFADDGSGLRRSNLRRAMSEGFLAGESREQLLTRLRQRDLVGVGACGALEFDACYRDLAATPEVWREYVADRCRYPVTFAGAKLLVTGEIELNRALDARYIFHPGAVRGRHFANWYCEHLMANLTRPVRTVVRDLESNLTRVLDPVPPEDAAARLNEFAEMVRSGFDRVPAFFADASFVFRNEGAAKAAAYWPRQLLTTPNAACFFPPDAFRDPEFEREFTELAAFFFPEREVFHVA